MSLLLYYGYHRKYNEISLIEDSKLFTGNDINKPKTLLFDEYQVRQIKDTYVSELTSKNLNFLKLFKYIYFSKELSIN